MKNYIVIMVIILSGFCFADQKKFKNSLGQEFVYIKPGSFLMGSGHSPNPKKIIIKEGYYIQTTEVTQGQWLSLMKKNPGYRCEREEDDYPINRATWYEVKEFIKKLNRREKTNKYRLPKEVEWEYACRAGNNGYYCFGDDLSKLRKYAWCNLYSAACRYKQVAKKKPNKWGLYDMHGNVQEWCEEWFISNGIQDREWKVIRGGAANHRYYECTSYYRHGMEPDVGAAGFRIVRDIN